MTQRFNNFVPWILQWEGAAYENDPDDPGGATKYGIDSRSHPKEDIRNLTEVRAKEIYFDFYWIANCCEDLAYPLGEVVMNIAVNAGSARAGRWLQAEVGAGIDGKIGPKTVLLAASRNARDLADMLIARLKEHYHEIAKGRMAKYYKGWMNRTESLKHILVNAFPF